MEHRSGWSWFLLVGLLTASAVLMVGVAGSAAQGSSIVPAPDFSTWDLAQPASYNWPTNGGSTTNDRFSELSEINTGDVSQLKGLYKVTLRGDGLAAKYSGESQPIEYDGTLYITTGDDDVFAINAATGGIDWEYKANLNQNISTVCCGWLNRGIGLGDGMVFLGQLDGKVVALSQQTGKVIWEDHPVAWQSGYTITGSPLYMDGKIYIGTVGAEFATRGRLLAFNASTGKRLWTFYTIPGPGQPGNNSWPKGTNAYLRGGASVWSTPAVDPNLGLMYITTGNAGDDWYGGLRAGKDLYTSSIVAVNVNTGKVAWYFQEVHHDIWDFDTPSPPLLFNATVNGETVPGIGAAGKTGWDYMLNRQTGKPLYGIVERPVPQDPQEQTYPTQPIPLTGSFVVHGKPPANDLKSIIAGVAAQNKNHLPVVVANQTFVPPSTSKWLIYAPSAAGGDNWEPTSYNPDTQMIYVCAGDTGIGVLAANGAFKPGQSYDGIAGFAGAFNGGTGTVTALDANSGDVVWQLKWNHPCYSGTVTTAGGLVFVGQSTGQFQAYDAWNGKLLWGYQTGAGADDTPAVFEENGQEEIAFLSAGNSLEASPHGDTLWVFALNGKLPPASPPGKGAGTKHK